MHDFWTITCNVCGAKRELTIAVPGPSELVNQILDGSIEVKVIPTRDEVRRRFAGQVMDQPSVREGLIEEVLKQLELDQNLEKVIGHPRFLLAARDDLNLSEFFSV